MYIYDVEISCNCIGLGLGLGASGVRFLFTLFYGIRLLQFFTAVLLYVVIVSTL